MRELAPALKAHIETGATTLCRCWRVTRRDGTVLGFTEHDADLTVDGTRFLAASGFSASEAETALGLAAPNGEVAGAFSSEAISDGDLERGLYDGARVEVLLVNWAEPAQFLLEHVREIGEVTRTENSFRAELRGLAARLDQPMGRVYGRRCDARLGDARCGLSLSAFKAMGAIVAADSLQASVSGIASFASGWFGFGVLTFTSGALAGRAVDIAGHQAGNPARLTFWLPLPEAPAIGDTFEIFAGCDKSFAACKAKFGNGLNFQGFPHMPGSDFAYSYVSGATAHDGSVLMG
ncbi:DUF2163 domain-containing protein [Rhizobium sp. C4]|uniref:DUF2163 domain-containing protein n=1 Tax=Rhizobium sp. C4 TaxID=1349800 RepID=UPI001E2AB334|nr:DUF2163 domain-containing protein [Rhizobium sp. C4]MCD2172019.1 DUF2163 domain-containing protein [Rhizobium sp. C4]